jgi:uncharacterized RDD family membrane protein YckC
VSTSSLNPYESPTTEQCAEPTPAQPQQLYGRAGGSRFLAAQIDHAFALVLFFTAAMSLADDRPFQILPVVAAVGVYLAYYFLSEWLLGATPGKFIFRLRVRQTSGERCTAEQTAVRTLLRLLEVNPLLFGAIPAGIAILATKRRQRIGDLLAGTVVVGV